MPIKQFQLLFIFLLSAILSYGQDQSIYQQELNRLANTTWVAKNPTYDDTLTYSAKSYKYQFEKGIHQEHLKVIIYADMNTIGEQKVWEGYQLWDAAQQYMKYHSIGVAGQIVNGIIEFKDSLWVNHFTATNYDGTEGVYKDESYHTAEKIISKSYMQTPNGEWVLQQELIFQLAPKKELKEGRVTSIGGIFFKSKNPALLKAWYAKHLGFDTDEWGTNFEWRQTTNQQIKGFTQWGPFIESTKYFAPSDKAYMLNYRVDNLDRLLKKLKANNVKILDKVETVEYGKFVHILDLEGNKIQLWEPVDKEYDKIVKARTY